MLNPAVSFCKFHVHKHTSAPEGTRNSRAVCLSEKLKCSEADSGSMTDGGSCSSFPPASVEVGGGRASSCCGEEAFSFAGVCSKEYLS